MLILDSENRERIRPAWQISPKFRGRMPSAKQFVDMKKGKIAMARQTEVAEQTEKMYYEILE